MAEQRIIKAVIGLGNPGKQYAATRHNIGFCVLDALCDQLGGTWQTHKIFLEATAMIDDSAIRLIKPQTYMNSSGAVMPELKKKGITCDQILVVHDELQLVFGQVKYRFGGSARGHNGLKSIMQQCGQEFGRICCGIGRPEHQDEVPNYVLQPFTESVHEVEAMQHKAIELILHALKQQ